MARWVCHGLFVHLFERSVNLPIPAAEVFAWHRRPGAFERLAPTWEELEVVARTGGTIEDGARLHFRVHQGPLALDWVARHEGFVEGRRFVDVAERSPFRAWVHSHQFSPRGDGSASTLRDEVRYELPLDRLSWPLARSTVEAMLERMFRQRHVRTISDLRRHGAVAGLGPRRLRIVGEDQRLGAQLEAFWTTGGNAVVGESEPCDALVELAGARSVAAPRFADDARPCLVRVLTRGQAGASQTPAMAAAQQRHARIVTLVVGEVVGAAGPLTRGRRRALEREAGRRGWIDRDDLIGLIHHAIYTESIAGEVEATVEGAGKLAHQFGRFAQFSVEFLDLARSLDHRQGRDDAGAVERALAQLELELGQARARDRAPATPTLDSGEETTAESRVRAQ